MFRTLCTALAALVLVSCGGGGGSDPAAGMAGSGEMLAAGARMVPLSPASLAPAAKHAADPLLKAEPIVLVNALTLGDQTLRAVGATSDGGFEAVWISTGGFLYLQAYDEDGARVGAQVHLQLEIAAPTLDASRVAIEQSSFAVLDDGSVVAVYNVTRQLPGAGISTVTGTFFQLFASDGTLLVPETQVAAQEFAGPKGPFLGLAAVTALSGGGFVVASPLNRYSTLFGSIVSLSLYWFDAQGQPVGAPVAAGDFAELRYDLVADAHGGFTLSTRHTSNVYQTLYTAYHYLADHTASTIVAPSTRPVRLLPLAQGYVLFTGGTEVTMQRLDAQGIPVGAPAIVASLPFATSELADGTYVAVWQSNGSFSVQQFAADMTSLGTPVPIATQGGAPVLATLAAPGFVAAWTAPGTNGDADVYAQRFIEAHGHLRKACLDSAKAQGLKGRERKAFVDACAAGSA